MNSAQYYTLEWLDKQPKKSAAYRDCRGKVLNWLVGKGYVEIDSNPKVKPDDRIVTITEAGRKILESESP